jgi:GNAT superfamily N-acetyltransferase
MRRIVPVETGRGVEISKQLFVEYLDFLKGRFCGYAPEPWFGDYCRDYEEGLVDFPGCYGQPEGCMLLAKYDGKIAGCVGLRKVEDGICEMKRLFVRREYRRSGVGRALAEAVVEKAREMGYARMWLDTVMEEAKALYYSMGFKDIEAYEFIPLDGTVYMELKLK